MTWSGQNSSLSLHPNEKLYILGASEMPYKKEKDTGKRVYLRHLKFIFFLFIPLSCMDCVVSFLLKSTLANWSDWTLVKQLGSEATTILWVSLVSNDWKFFSSVTEPGHRFWWISDINRLIIMDVYRCLLILIEYRDYRCVTSWLIAAATVVCKIAVTLTEVPLFLDSGYDLFALI